MRVVFLRHASAVPRGSPEYPDADRPLLGRGQREARDAGRALRRLRLSPDAIVTSPYVRARETARLAAGELGGEAVEDDALASGFSVDELPAVLARHRAGCLLLVGHDPDFSSLVRWLTGARVRLAKGGAAAVDLGQDEAREGDAELRWLLRPRHLRLLARS